MAIDRVLAVVPVSDVAVSTVWYGLLLGRPPTNRPMESLSEWQVTDTGWLQVFLDHDRAGSGLVNFSVDDLNAYVAELRGRGCVPDPIQEVTNGVLLSGLIDPDGNQITLIGNFRQIY